MSGLAACPACWGPRSAGALHTTFVHTTTCPWADLEARQVRRDLALYGLAQPVHREATDVETAMLRALDVDLPRRGRPLLTVSWPRGQRRSRRYDGADLDAPADLEDAEEAA